MYTFKEAFRRQVQGVSVVTSGFAPHSSSATLSSVVSVSAELRLVSFVVARVGRLAKSLLTTSFAALHFLDESSIHIAKASAKPSSEKFLEFNTAVNKQGVMYFTDPKVRLDCSAVENIELFDKILFVMRVDDIFLRDPNENNRPLAYYNQGWGYFTPEGDITAKSGKS